MRKPDMSQDENAWKGVLEGYSHFLKERKLALPKHRPHLVRWVREFLTFAAEHPGYTFEQTLDLFLATLGNGSASMRGRSSRLRMPFEFTGISIGTTIARVRMKRKVSALSAVRRGYSIGCAR